MATIGGDTYPTLLDVSKRLDPDGKIPTIIEVLMQENEILQDMMWKEGNLPTGNISTIRSDLPEIYWRNYNEGVPITKSKTAPVTDTVGMMEAFSSVDAKLAELNGNESAFRASEAKAFLQSFNQSLAQSLFYATGGEKFRGLATRYQDTDSDTNPYAEYILDGGGSGSTNTSIWLCGWGDHTGYGIFPKGSKAGFQHEDLGRRKIEVSTGNYMMALEDRFSWDAGLTIRDGRYFVRIANVDVNALTGDVSAGADLVDLMTQAVEQIWSLTGVRPAFYMNRTVRSFLRRQRVHFPNVQLKPTEVAGKMELSFDEVPIRRVDQLINTEAKVTFA